MATVPGGSNGFIFINSGATVSPTDSSTTVYSDIIGVRTANNSSKLYIDGALITTATGADSGSLTTSPVCRGARGTGASTADSFNSFIEQVTIYGSSRDATQIAQIRARVATLKAALGR